MSRRISQFNSELRARLLLGGMVENYSFSPDWRKGGPALIRWQGWRESDSRLVVRLGHNRYSRLEENVGQRDGIARHSGGFISRRSVV